MQKRIHFGTDEPQSEATGNIKARGSELFLNAISSLFAEYLNVGWNDRRIVEGLLATAFKGSCDQLLTDFLHIELEVLAESVSRALKVEKKVDYRHAPHAKFATMLEEFREKSRL